MKSNGYVVQQFQVPEVAPKPVLEANKKFQELSAELLAVTGEWDGAIRTREEDIADLNKAAAAARVNGTAPPDDTVYSVDANIARLKAEREVLIGAVDIAGNQLAEACGKHRAEWLEKLDKIDADATERLRAALAEVRAALAELHVARTAPQWVRDFNVQQARSGGETPWHGGSVGGSGALKELDKIVTPERVLAGYRDGQPIFEEIVVGQGRRPVRKQGQFPRRGSRA